MKINLDFNSLDLLQNMFIIYYFVLVMVGRHKSPTAKVVLFSNFYSYCFLIEDNFVLRRI
jgi:hypothetical protein